ncbi:MAG: hypothetical protein M1831_005928 [Alyxoria varia]|nr:MAG: hypothetical protein M1831_005928 [Alyxoria varia]
MSAQSRPVTDERFSDALGPLPTETLYDTAASIKNSLVHLNSSIDQLQPYVRDGDETCKQAVEENLGVIRRMTTRLSLLEQELEKRGMPWMEELNGGQATTGTSTSATQVHSGPQSHIEVVDIRSTRDHRHTPGRHDSSATTNENSNHGVHL